MEIKRVQIKVKGFTPLLMHAHPKNEMSSMEKRSAQEKAEHVTYRDPDGNLCMPSLNVFKSIVVAGHFGKGKGRMSQQQVLACSVGVAPAYLVLTPQTYVVDEQWVTITATRGKIMRALPRFDEWAFEFELAYDGEMLTETEMRQAVDNAGLKVGLGDFRPLKSKGHYGKYIVTGWEC